VSSGIIRKGAVAKTVREKFMERLPGYARRDDDMGCLLWERGARGDGYADMYITGVSSRRAHRISYETFVGEIPGGMDLDHICAVKNCVEPTHLRPLPRADNSVYRDKPEHHPDSGFTGVFFDSGRGSWALATDLRRDSGTIEYCLSQQEAHSLLRSRREAFARVGTLSENREQLRRLWALTKADPSMSILPLYP